LAAFGGGTLRDILLDQRPFFWVENELVLWAVLGLCILAIWNNWVLPAWRKD
jgi:uncharacterized membrane protein YeiH